MMNSTDFVSCRDRDRTHADLASEPMHLTTTAFVFVFLDCHNKITKTGCLQQQKFTFSKFWRLGIQDQGASQFGFWQEFSFLLVDGHLLTVPSHGGESELSGVSSYKKTNSLGSDLI